MCGWIDQVSGVGQGTRQGTSKQAWRRAGDWMGGWMDGWMDVGSAEKAYSDVFYCTQLNQNQWGILVLVQTPQNEGKVQNALPPSIPVL